MDEPVFEPDQEKPHFEPVLRAINAHLGFHRAYGSQPEVLAADAPGCPRLAALSEAVGLDFEPLLEDVLAMFGAPGADSGAQKAGTPPPMGSSTPAAMDDAAEAAALGGWWAALPPILQPLARHASVALLARHPSPAGGLRSHPLGPALLEGVAAGAEGGEEPAQDAAERMRRSLAHGLSAARVTALLGPVAATCISPHLLEWLVGESAGLLNALAEDLRRRPRRIHGLHQLIQLLHRLDPERGRGPSGRTRGRPEDLLVQRIDRGIKRIEDDLELLTGTRQCLYLGPPGLVGALGLSLAGCPEPVEGSQETPEARGEPRASAAPAPPPPVERPPVRASAPPRLAVLIRLRAWCRRMFPLLTPSLQERLLLPLPPPA